MKTTIKLLAALFYGALVSAAHAVDYNSVFIASEMNVIDANNHQEEIFIGQEGLIIDFGLKTFEFINLNEGILSRTMNFNDPTGTGLTLGFNTAFDADDCDQGQAPPCTEPFTQLGNYITNAGSGDSNEPFSAFTTTNREFFAYVGPAVDTFGPGAFVADIAMGAAVEPPTTLTLADITGDYFVVSKWTGFRSDVNYSAEFGGLSLVDLSFNGNGGCAGSVVDSEMEQSNSWPDLGTRANVRVGTESDVFTACSYTVNAGNGTVTVTLTTFDGVESEEDIVTLFVSSGYRFLIARQAGTEVDGTETYYEGAMILAVKQASSASNSSLSGTYLSVEYTQVQSVVGTGTGGVEADSARRSVFIFNADTPDGSGYSTCDVSSSVYVVGYRAMGGSVDLGTDYQVSDVLNESTDIDFCRYRVATGGKVELETSEDGVDWRVLDAAFSSDQQALVGGVFSTDADPLVPDTYTFLTNDEAARSTMFIAVKLDAGGDTQTVLDNYASLWLPGDGATPDDFDNDGDSDVLLRNTSTGQWRRFDMQSGLAASSGNPLLWTGSAYDFQATGDFDGDGDADVLVRNSSTGAWWRFTLESGVVVGGGNPLIWSGSSWEFRAAGDFDGDGDDDVLLRNTSTGQWRRFDMQSGVAVSSGNPLLWTGSAYAFQAVGDFDGDGDADVIVRNPSTGAWWQFTMESGVVAGGGNPLLWSGLSWEFRAAADFDGDGVDDVLLRNASGQWRRFDMQSGASASSGNPLLWTGPTYTFQMTGDFDGDGDADVLVRDLSSGAWYRFTIESGAVVGGANPLLWSGLFWEIRAN